MSEALSCLSNKFVCHNTRNALLSRMDLSETVFSKALSKDYEYCRFLQKPRQKAKRCLSRRIKTKLRLGNLISVLFFLLQLVGEWLMTTGHLQHAMSGGLVLEMKSYTVNDYA